MSSDRDAMYFPPPPPPPPPVLPLLLNDLPQFSSTCTIIPMQTTNCTVLSVVPVPCTCRQNPQQELLQARNRLWHFEGGQDPPHIKFYRYIEPVLQDGPKCGLVALSMASSCTSRPLSVEQLFEEARSRGFTNHGEMFSVDDMATLAREMFEGSCREIEVLAGGLGQDKKYVLHHLNSGSILLIPYDADANHSPCCRRGHKAHWAVISGVIVSGTGQHTYHLLARQGKSRHLAVWSYDDLQRSNENLVELDPGRAADGRAYVLPAGGVAAGLGGRAILIHGLGAASPL